MAEFVVSSVGQTIGKLLIDEAKFLGDVEGNVEELQKELERIQGFLRDADARREHEQVVGVWVTQLRDIAYDAEDVIEQYFLRATLKKKEQNIIKAYACFVAKCVCLQVHAVGTEIEGLKSSISDLRRSMQDHGLQPVKEGERGQARALMPKRTYAHFEEDIVGREDSIKMLLKELKDERHHRVISIWGMGGLGKTTLAKEVFTHNEVKNNFDGFAWFCVSQDYHAKDIVKDILVKLIPYQKEMIMKMEEDELYETLYKIQQEKRCIVVLDDIWTKQAWDGLRNAFPIKNTISKLLITTRKKDVAEYIDPHGFLLELQCLSYHESWELLKKRVFPETHAIGLSSVRLGVGQSIGADQPAEGITRREETEGQIPIVTENMKRLGDELLKKCGGLPLAIVVLGGLLAINKWETVYRNINLHFNDKSDVSKVLALSYDDLPCHLKPCFLYLGSFPEDTEISAMKVIHMWIAEGFVLPNAYDEDREITVEDVAEQYLIELVKRGLVQVRLDSSGNIKICHLHDLVRDLCVFKARHEKFLSFLNIRQDNERKDSSSSMAIEGESTCKTRRLSVNMNKFGKRKMISKVGQIGRTMLHLRTLMFFGVTRHQMQLQPIFINCKFLRVLKLEQLDNWSGIFPESVGELVHLRFLSLAGSAIESLPKSMGNLVCMEFLDLCTSPYVEVAMPNVLWKMRRLRYLHLPSIFFSVSEESYGHRQKLRLDALKNLRTLRNFCPRNCDVNDVGKLTNLRKLTVTLQIDLDNLEIIPQLSKFNLKHLQSSSFKFSCSRFMEGDLCQMSSCHHSGKLFIRGEIEKLPEPKNLPQPLRKLVLLRSELEEDPMPILEKLPHLVVLLLGYLAFMGKEMVCSAGGFPQLKHLLLHRLDNLEEWRVAEGAMPHLSRLGIQDCPRLKAVPQRCAGVYTSDCAGDIYKELRGTPWEYRKPLWGW